MGTAQGGAVGDGVSEGSAVSVGRDVKVKVTVGGMAVPVGAGCVGVASAVAACGKQDARMPVSNTKAKKVLRLIIFPNCAALCNQESLGPKRLQAESYVCRQERAACDSNKIGM